jgi:hypothetical protein
MESPSQESRRGAAARLLAAATRGLGIVLLLVAAPAMAQFGNPTTTSTGVEATAVNNDTHPGVSSNKNGNGPLADSASSVVGLASAFGSASVDAFGLHATSAVRGPGDGSGSTASARGFVGLADPFIITPLPGFTGTMALLRIPYSFSGRIDAFPSLAACTSCAGSVQADLGVDGMTEQFHFLGVSSLGTLMNPTFVEGAISHAGVLEGLVPVNTELYLRADLLTGAHCQSFASACGVDVLFGSSLDFGAYSPDAVSIAWGLAPIGVTAAVPEPSTWLLLVAGIAAIGKLQRSRRPTG